jgi:uncharacterized membrane protein
MREQHRKKQGANDKEWIKHRRSAMKPRLKHLWETLSSSLWFVPTVMTLLALGLAFGSIALDDVTGDTGWAYGGGPEGAREVLGTIAASMITVAGVAFSVTIVALTLASQQFGPRLLRNFMRDRGNQLVLGTFISTFTYCLIVLRSIRSSGSEFVPHISVTFAILLALASRWGADLLHPPCGRFYPSSRGHRYGCERSGLRN